MAKKAKKASRPAKFKGSVAGWPLEAGTGEHTVGNVVIHGIGRMTPAGRLEVAAWLRKLATFVEKEENVAETFSSNYKVARRP